MAQRLNSRRRRSAYRAPQYGPSHGRMWGQFLFGSPKRAMATAIVLVILASVVYPPFGVQIMAMVMSAANQLFGIALFIGLMWAAVKWLFSWRPK